MADAPVVHIGENSPQHVARIMAHEILFRIEEKKWGQITRVEYLKTVSQCLQALGQPYGVFD